MRTSKPITVTLGPQQASLEARLKSGAYGSASEVLRAGLRALDREEAALDEILRRKVEASLADSRPSVVGGDCRRAARAAKAKGRGGVPPGDRGILGHS